MGYAGGRLVNVYSKPAGIHVVLNREVGVRCRTFGECPLKTCRNMHVFSSEVGVRCRTFGDCPLKTCRNTCSFEWGTLKDVE